MNVAKRLIGSLVVHDSLADAAERYLRKVYRWRTYQAWVASPTLPEWFDHRADLYGWSETQTSLWLERGVFARALMQPGCRVLDLCCGDGFYPFHFYASVAGQIDAVDRNEEALAHARRRHADPKISYTRMDIVRDPYPGADYDVVCWDAAIEHFSLEDVRTVLAKVRDVLKPGGVLSGYTLLRDLENPLTLHHVQEFETAGAAERLLREVFPSATTFVTTYPERRNLYFRAGDEPTALQDFRSTAAETSGSS